MGMGLRKAGKGWELNEERKCYVSCAQHFEAGKRREKSGNGQRESEGVNSRLNSHAKPQDLFDSSHPELAESCREIEGMQVAIRVRPKDGGLGWWLVSTASERSLADDDAPVYSAREWLEIITSGLSHDEIRALDRDVKPYKSIFDGEVVRIDKHGKAQECERCKE